MSRSAAEKISILERTLSRVLKNAGLPRGAAPSVAARASAVTAAPASFPSAPPVTAVPPVAAKSQSAEHRSVTRELDFSPPADALGSAPPAQTTAETTPPEAFAPSPPLPPAVPRVSTIPPPAEVAARTAPPPPPEEVAPAAARTSPPPAMDAPESRPTSNMEVLDEEDVVPTSEQKRAELARHLEVTHGAEDDEEVERELPPRSFQPEPPPESVVHVGAAPEPAVERMSTRPPPGASPMGEPSRPPASSRDDLEAHVPQRATPMGPSDAQLGATIELEEGPHHSLELAADDEKSPPPPPAEEEEVLPAAQAPGRFAASLRPSAEMAAVQARGGPATVVEQPAGDRPTPVPPPPAERESQPPGSVPRPRASSPPGTRLAVPSSPPLYQPPRSGPPPAPVALDVSPQVIGRPSIPGGEPSLFLEAARRPAPATFGEMLDDALSLGA